MLRAWRRRSKQCLLLLLLNAFLWLFLTVALPSPWDDVVPAGQELPSAAKERHLDDQGHRLALKELPLGYQGQPSASNGLPPGDQGLPLAAKERHLDDQGHRLALKELPLGYQGQPSALNGLPPGDQGLPLAAKERHLDDQGHRLALEELPLGYQGQPSALNWLPLGDQGLPLAAKERHLDDQGHRLALEELPLGYQGQPSALNWLPLGDQGLPLAAKERHLDDQGHRLALKELPLGYQGQPSALNELPPGDQGLPLAAKELHLGYRGNPMALKELPLGYQGQPLALKGLPQRLPLSTNGATVGDKGPLSLFLRQPSPKRRAPLSAKTLPLAHQSVPSSKNGAPMSDKAVPLAHQSLASSKNGALLAEKTLPLGYQSISSTSNLETSDKGIVAETSLDEQAQKIAVGTYLNKHAKIDGIVSNLEKDDKINVLASNLQGHEESAVIRTQLEEPAKVAVIKTHFEKHPTKDVLQTKLQDNANSSGVRAKFVDGKMKLTPEDPVAKTKASVPRIHWGVSRVNDWETEVGTPSNNHVISFVDNVEAPDDDVMSLNQTQTSDHWPLFSRSYFPGPIPKSPYKPRFVLNWGFNTTSFLQRPRVKGKAAKLITWMVTPRHVPPLPEPVRLRMCPEMPCLLSTNVSHQFQSSALLWSGQLMRESPPLRTDPDQVFVFHNNEPQKSDWIQLPSFRWSQWTSAFNWTWTYRADSDIAAFYGYVVKRAAPLHKNYTQIVAAKTDLAVWMCSHCQTEGLRENYIQLLQQHVPIDVFGKCGPFKCARSSDDTCFRHLSTRYKFLLAFENAMCTDYISEKFFRYLEADVVLVARGCDEYRFHAPPGTYINTNDFNSTEELGEYLTYLDTHPEDYVKILKKKDEYQSLFEDWPIRNRAGTVTFMQYHLEAMGYCEMCRRLWDVDDHRKQIPDFVSWFDKGNCYDPTDLR